MAVDEMALQQAVKTMRELWPLDWVTDEDPMRCAVIVAGAYESARAPIAAGETVGDAKCTCDSARRTLQKHCPDHPTTPSAPSDEEILSVEESRALTENILVADDEMVEVAAKAMYPLQVPWEKCAESCKDIWRGYAKAAIQAIEEAKS